MKYLFRFAASLICWDMFYFNRLPLKVVLILVLSGMSLPAWAANTAEKTAATPAVAASSASPAPAAADPGALPQLDYTYPFTDPRLAQQLSARRMVVELFTSLDCLFCPKAEHLLADLATKTGAITLACHTDPEGDAYPLAQEFCTRRQSAASTRLSDGLLYTPQMVINGHVEAAGHEFEDVKLALTRALPDEVRPIAVRASKDQGMYAADIPKIDLGSGKSADIYMVVVRKPYTVPTSMRQSVTHKDPLVRVAKTFASLGGWDGRAKTLTIPFTPAADEAGFVILIERSDGMIIAAQDVETP